MTTTAPLRAALVYPPMGPSGIPSLGLGLLAAGIRARGIECRCFYWNFDLIEHMPGRSLRQRYDAYHSLSGRIWFPFNEWCFSRALYGEASAERERAARAELEVLAAGMPDGPLRKGDLLQLHADAPAIVADMARRLEGYDVVGIASTFYQSLAGLALAREVKRRWPDKLVILGGANCESEMGRTLLEQFAFIDCVFSGEVDHAVPELLARRAAGASIDDVPGLLRRAPDGRVTSGPPAPPLHDLDALPYPDFDDYMAARARRGLAALLPTTLALESSRGCWWGMRQHCTFCGLNANGMGYRHKTVERFRDEVETIVRRYDAEFLFMTDNILSMSYYGDFMDWARRSGLGVQYFYEIKANLKRKHVERLALAGVTAVQPGIESFSTPVLAAMHKGTTAAQNVAFLKYAGDYGVLTAYNLLVGFPDESPEDYRRMAQELPKLVHLRPPSSMPPIEFHRFSPYHQEPARFGLRLRPHRAYRHLYPFEDEVLARLVYVFEREDQDQIQRDYLGPVVACLTRWHRAYRDGCTLCWRQDGGDVVIEDRRPCFPPRRYRLRDYAARLFHELDSPRSLADLQQHAAHWREQDAIRLLDCLFGRAPSPAQAPAAVTDLLVELSAEQFLADPERGLQPLLDAGVVFVDAGSRRAGAARHRLRVAGDGAGAPDADRVRYVALPLRADHVPLARAWLEIGV
jgi:ribosomal peptide maturation radical SAM protein 1